MRKKFFFCGPQFKRNKLKLIKIYNFETFLGHKIASGGPYATRGPRVWDPWLRQYTCMYCIVFNYRFTKNFWIILCYKKLVKPANSDDKCWTQNRKANVYSCCCPLTPAGYFYMKPGDSQGAAAPCTPALWVIRYQFFLFHFWEYSFCKFS